jgi:hypothetical protein
MRTDHFTSRTAGFQKPGGWRAVFTATFMLALCMNSSWSRAAEPSQPSLKALPSFPDWQDLYVGDFGKACIYKITSDKKVSVYAKDTPAPDNICFDEKGVMYVAGGDGVRTVTPTEDGSPATKKNGHVKVLVDGMHNVHGVTFDKKGNLWIGEYLGDDTGKKLKDGRPIYGPGDIKILSSDGTLRKVATEAVYSMTTSPEGDVYISVIIGGKLIKITEDGTKTVVAKGFVSRGATFVSDGTCYAVGPGKDPRSGGINKLTKDGTMTQIVDFRDEYGSQHPYSVAIDANGNLFQSDVSHTKDLPNSKKDDGKGGYIFQIDSDGKRSVFMRVGAGPAFMAFWPTTNRATKSNGK